MNATQEMTCAPEAYSASKIVNEVIAHHDKLQLLQFAAHGRFRENIVAIEKMMAEMPGVFFGDTDNCPLTHSFANGIYVRQILIPRGTLYVGRIHKCDHPLLILAGEISVVSEFSGVQRLRPPMSIISKAGTKRFGYAHQDTIMVTIHRTGETDPDKLGNLLFADTYEEFEALSQPTKEIA